MLKKTIKYKDYNGVEREEDFYFNLSQAEVMQMEMSVDGGYAEMIKKVVAAQDGPTIMKIFTDLISDAYGEKANDGRQFKKSPELSQAFRQTEAYSVLFMELVTNADAAAKFVEGIFPADSGIKKQIAAPNNN